MSFRVRRGGGGIGGAETEPFVRGRSVVAGMSGAPFGDFGVPSTSAEPLSSVAERRSSADFYEIVPRRPGSSKIHLAEAPRESPAISPPS